MLPLVLITALASPLVAELRVAAGPVGTREPQGFARTMEAERLAAEAISLLPADPARALVQARRALAMTEEFEPTAFVDAGRKGEVVEDAFVAARQRYARHRAVLYEAVGKALEGAGQPLAASRYLRRALALEPSPGRGLALARTLIALGRGHDALRAMRQATGDFARLDPEGVAQLVAAVDLAGLPSAQVEIDRGRLASLGTVELREGPLPIPAGTRLSNSPAFRVDQASLTLVYVAEAGCRRCSADLEDLARVVAREVRVLALAPGDDQDAELRQVLGLYRRPWPVLLGRDLAATWRLEPRSALLVARSGWTLAVVRAPFGAELAAAIHALQRVDVAETLPRAAWNRRPPDRSPAPAPPGLLPEGLAPGEDEPAPERFSEAVAALRGGRPLEAARLFESLVAQGDGWLLPPEGRLNRAVCLAAAGQRDAARRLLLRTGDSRFEAEIDGLLERVAGGR